MDYSIMVKMTRPYIESFTIYVPFKKDLAVLCCQSLMISVSNFYAGSMSRFPGLNQCPASEKRVFSCCNKESLVVSYSRYYV